MTPFNYLFTALVLISLSLHTAAQETGHEYYKEGPPPTKQEIRVMFFDMLDKGSQLERGRPKMVEFLKSEFGVTTKKAKELLDYAVTVGTPLPATMVMTAGISCDDRIRAANGFTRREVYAHMEEQGGKLARLAASTRGTGLKKIASNKLIREIDAWGAENLAPDIHSKVVDAEAVLADEKFDIDTARDQFCDSLLGNGVFAR